MMQQHHHIKSSKDKIRVRMVSSTSKHEEIWINIHMRWST